MSLHQQLNSIFGCMRSPSLFELKQGLEQVELNSIYSNEEIPTPEKGRDYGRKSIFNNGEVECVLVHIPAYKKTTIHNHGSSIGCARVLEGEMSNVIYTLDEYGYPIKKGEERIDSQRRMHVTDGLIHEMKNERKDRVVSLHVYSPPLSEVRAYLPYQEVLDFVI